MFVMGVNEKDYKLDIDIVSNAINKPLTLSISSTGNIIIPSVLVFPFNYYAFVYTINIYCIQFLFIYLLLLLFYG